MEEISSTVPRGRYQRAWVLVKKIWELRKSFVSSNSYTVSPFFCYGYNLKITCRIINKVTNS